MQQLQQRTHISSSDASNNRKKGEEESDSSAGSDVDRPTASLMMLRTASGGELSASLRVESQSYTESHDDDHVAQARAALSWEEKETNMEKEIGEEAGEAGLTFAQRSPAVEKEQVNIHLGALLRTASRERDS